MSDNPTPVTTTNAPARASARWVWIALAVLLAGVAGVWLGDVPNRYRAGEAMKAGRVALLKSDYTAALQAFRAAALLRPTDEGIIARYEQTQSTWLELAERKVDKLDAKAAYLAWHELPSAETVFMEPMLGKYQARTAEIDAAAREAVKTELATLHEQAEGGDFDSAYTMLKALEPFRALVPELAERRQEIETLQVTNALAAAQAALKDEKFDDAREALKPVAGLAAKNEDYAKLATAIGEAEVRALLRDAGKAVGESKLQEARELLDKAAATKVLADEVTKAREEALKSIRAQLSYGLAVAISRNDRAKTEEVLASAETLAGWKKVPADDLLKPANVAAFLETLKAFDLGSERQAKFADRLDVPLVLWARKNFQDQAGVDEHLRESFTQWSRYLATQHMPSAALFIDELARQYGAKADDAWRKETLDRVMETVGVTIAVRDPEPDKNAPDKLNADATAALKAALEKKLGGWPKLVPFDAKQPATVVLRGYYDGFNVQDYPDVTKKTVRYQSGTEQVPNRQRQELVAEHNELLERYNNVVNQLNSKLEYVSSVNNNPYASDWDRSQLVYKNIEIASDRNLLGQWRQQLAELRRQGDALPKTVPEPVYDDEPYEYIQHHYQCLATWGVAAYLHGSEEQVAEYHASTEFRTDEVAGDASRGVPVKRAAAVPEAKLLPGLARELVKQAGNVDEIVRQLPDMTLGAFYNFHTANKSGTLLQTEQFLGLAYAWERAGRKLPQTSEILNAARQNFGLPPAETVAKK